METDKLAAFPNRMVILGFGSIGTAVLPLMLRHLALSPSKITVVARDEPSPAAMEYLMSAGAQWRAQTLLPDNWRNILDGMLAPGDFLLNLSVEVSSLALLRYCRDRQILYLDTCTEPWPGGYTDIALPLAERTNFALRESVLSLAREPGTFPTAVITHGANPGLVSHLVRKALVQIACDTNLSLPDGLQTRESWARLARNLGIRAIHIAECDTQVDRAPRAQGEFVNTWSPAGFISEGLQPAELGWGTHEHRIPAGGVRLQMTHGQVLYVARPGASVRVRSWVPMIGPIHGYLITHAESLSIADYLADYENGRLVWQPTVHYAYRPSPAACMSLDELAMREWEPQTRLRLAMDSLSEGYDILGVLLMGHSKGAYWYGSILSLEESRALAPFNNATSLQVASSVLAGIIQAIRHPREGIVEPEALDYETILEIAAPYLGRLEGYYTDWTPLTGRGILFPEKLDEEDPWQFSNILVTRF